MDIKTHCPKCQAEFLTELSQPLLTELGLQQRDPDTEAKLAEDTAKLEVIAYLEEENARLESEEHKSQVVADWLSQDFEDADPFAKAELGRKLGLTAMFKEAEVVEEKELVRVAKTKEPALLAEVCWQDPKNDQYKKVQGLPIWILQKEKV